MRTLILLSLVSVSLVGACKWTEFDDLSDSTWAHSTTKPDVKSSDWGIAMTAANHAGDGGSLLVIGADSPTFATLKYDSGGGTSLGQGGIDLNEQFAINAIPDQPLLLSDASDAVALIVPTGDGRTILEGGTDATKPHQLDVVEKDPQPQGAAFTGAGSGLDVLVAGEGVSSGGVAANNFHVVPVVAGTTTSCSAFESDAQTSLNAVAITVAPGLGSAGQVFAWTAGGTLVGYDLSLILANCGTSGSATSIIALPDLQDSHPEDPASWGSDSVAIGFSPVTASIALVPQTGSGDQFAILAGHTDPTKDDKGEVIVVDLTLGQVVGTPLQLTDSLRGFAVGELADGKQYMALGFPNRTVNGTASAGQVEVYEIDTNSASVITGTPALLLFDDQPDSNELFGRSITMTNFNDQQILVVGAENEIFSYYQTQLYGNTRK
jgi:hypothetical protein|nr:hypothetical protein [Kofleriaceae bacterium]